MDNSYYQEKKNMTSDFNEGKLQIFRLNNSWERFSNAIRRGIFLGENGANWVLDDVGGELARDMELEDEDKPIKERYSFKIDKINTLISQYKENPSILYKIIRLKERVLRRLQDEAGKGAKRSSDDEDAIDS